MRIVVIDSDCFVLGSILALCESQFPDDEMLGVRNGWFGIDRCRILQPDLVILEIELRDCDGLGLVPAIRAANPAARILVFTQICDPYSAHRVYSAGVDGYLCKRFVGPDELAVVMRAVMAGERSFDRAISQQQAVLRQDSNGFVKRLSDRELEFLSAIGAGMNNRELAKRFRVSVSTANNHRASIMSKLSIKRSTDLMRFAAENGFTRLTSESHRLRPIYLQVPHEGHEPSKYLSTSPGVRHCG